MFPSQLLSTSWLIVCLLFCISVNAVSLHTDSTVSPDINKTYQLNLINTLEKAADDSSLLTNLINSDSFFGSEITNTGDIDGDEHDDLAVVAPLASKHVDDDSGILYLLNMNGKGHIKKVVSHPLRNINAAIHKYYSDITLKQPLIIKLASPGDINQDGVPDLIMADSDARYHGQSNVGVVFVLFLNRDGSIQSLQLINDQSSGITLDAGDKFGSTLSDIGDRDNDGIPDIIVGAPSEYHINHSFNGGQCTPSGALYTIHLKSDGRVKNFHKITATEPHSLTSVLPQQCISLGEGSLTNAGDINQDGVNDLAMGLPNTSVSHNGKLHPNAGAIALMMLSSEGSVKNTTLLSSSTEHTVAPQAYSYLGQSIISVGDLNGDNIPELMAGAYGFKTANRDNNAKQGAIYLFSSDNSGRLTYQTRVTSGENMDILLTNKSYFGFSLTLLGDSNQDQLPDIAIGTPGMEDGTYEGAVNIMSLKPSPIPYAPSKTVSLDEDTQLYLNLLIAPPFGRCRLGSRFTKRGAWRSQPWHLRTRRKLFGN